MPKKNNRLTFSDIFFYSDFQKEIDGYFEEIDKDTYKDSLQNKKNKIKIADLYFNTLYTVVPSDFDYSNGIYPKDQGILYNRIMLWNHVDDIPLFFKDDSKILEIWVNFDQTKDELLNLGAGTYTLEYIPNYTIRGELSSYEILY
jgi:hypothetical protein